MPGSCFGRSSIHRVYSLGDLSVGRRSAGKPALTERSESGDCPDCAAAAGAEAPRAPAHSCGIQALPEHLLEAILAKLEGTHNRPAHHSVWSVAAMGPMCVLCGGAAPFFHVLGFEAFPTHSRDGPAPQSLGSS